MPLLHIRHSWFLNYRLVLLVSMSLIVSIGYAIRFAQAPTFVWLNDAIGSIAYEIFWILFAAFLSPRTSLRAIAIGVCLATCGLEWLQLWHPPFLEAARATLAGRLVLGNTFSWLDFPPYVMGSWLGWLWARSTRRLARKGGEWGVGSGEWGVGSGEWGVGSGEWGVGSGEWGVGSRGRSFEF
ncbi:MAG: DUF2809 domain-containing protein [Tildeniella nuda ZEHNDER 1965/U140]|nr:DUF2809 domain-containing protein [Tildeniella nuda ZEHNDER 1965/U140]